MKSGNETLHFSHIDRSFGLLRSLKWLDRKRHSAVDIVRKLRRDDELTGEGKTGEDVAAELGVSAGDQLYNWRRAYGGMDADAAKELKELHDQNGRLKRLLAEAELVKDALREAAKGSTFSVMVVSGRGPGVVTLKFPGRDAYRADLWIGVFGGTQFRPLLAV